MADNNRIIWSEGMFLRPQHFQQHDRYIESLINGHAKGMQAHHWGISKLKVDMRLLAMGQFALSECAGIFQDGIPFDLPEYDDLPIPLDISQEIQDCTVYLSLPARLEGSIEIDSDEKPNNLARYHAVEAEVKDHNTNSNEVSPVVIGKLQTRLMLEPQERAGYICIGVARIVECRSDKNIVLDEEYLPPLINCLAIPRARNYIKEIYGLLHTRGEALAGRVSESGRGGTAEISDFLLLQVVNRLEPLFEHLQHLPTLHPLDFYRIVIQVAGELSTFTKKSKRPVIFPEYKHENLQLTFSYVMEEIRDCLGMVLEQNAIPIPLTPPKYGTRAAKIPDRNLLNNAFFVLAVNAQVASEQLRSQFPAQVKIGPVEQIQQLVRSALPGITVNSLPVAPRQIPYHAGFSYFELNKQGELWQQMSQSGGFAIHIAGNFPGLEIEFWAIKNG
ncbi:MAG: type VI secretion system baseplate subunit TssK [Methyloprofundus sp.]|nr:type VI secretion system baseplate subunit TssK [Methyloprofundus sp.]